MRNQGGEQRKGGRKAGEIDGGGEVQVLLT